MRIPSCGSEAEKIEREVKAEEERFEETLARGLERFEELAGQPAISADDAFTLAATYGFPIELTVELAEERGQPVDVDGYRQLMDEHREVSRGAAVESVRAIEGATTEFVGYEKTEVLTAIAALEPDEDGRFRAKLHESPFYAEGGGQVSDTGLHRARGDRRAGRARRRRARRRRPDAALRGRGLRRRRPCARRRPLESPLPDDGEPHGHAPPAQGAPGGARRPRAQAGSAVRPDKLRFDFTHGQALTAEERAAVERRVNEKVFENLPVLAYVVPLDEARNMGATMLFGEKYGEDVRVIEIPGYSMELCGGTHVAKTAEIGPFVILSEELRRRRASGGSRPSPRARPTRTSRAARTSSTRCGTSSPAYARRQPKAARAEVVDVDADVKAVEGVNVIAQRVDGLGADALLDLSDRFKQRNPPAAVVLGSVEDGRVHLVCNFDQAVAERVSASDVAKAAAAVVGGGGGGRPTMARAGGTDPEKLADALAEAERLVVGALTA